MREVIMDLKPREKVFTVSKAGKAAFLLCAFSGICDYEHSVDVEIMLTWRGCPRGTKLQSYITELQNCLRDDSLILRVRGQLRYLEYQDRDSGEEMQRYQVVADSVQVSDEEQAEFSNIVMEGIVKAASFVDIVKLSCKTPIVSFWLGVEADSGYDREGYMSLLVKGYGELAEEADRMDIQENSKLRVVGKLQATSYGILSIKLYDLRSPKARKHGGMNEQCERNAAVT